MLYVALIFISQIMLAPSAMLGNGRRLSNGFYFFACVFLLK
jgi:hypothetical protein